MKERAAIRRDKEAKYSFNAFEYIIDTLLKQKGHFYGSNGQKGSGTYFHRFSTSASIRHQPIQLWGRTCRSI